MALAAPLLTRMRVMKVKIESPRGTKIATDQAIQVFEPAINWESSYEPRSDDGLYRGSATAGVIVGKKGVCPFQTELRGNAGGGMETGLAILLQACGLAKTAEVYAVHSTHANDKTISIDFWQAGVKKGLAGVSGNVVFRGNVGERVMCHFDMTGIWQAPIDEALPLWSPSATPPMILQSGTFTFATESIKISSFELDMGNLVTARLDPAGVGGVAYYMIPWQTPVLKLMMEADTVAGFDYYGRHLAGTTAAVSLLVKGGTDKITFTLPKVVSRNLTEADRDDIKMYDFEGECLHSSGNDSVSLTAAVA